MSVYRIDVDRLPLGADNVLDLCLRLRMACNGSADPISNIETHYALAYLRHRLIHWAPSVLSTGKRFDECVRRLVIAAHDEVMERYDERLFWLRRDGTGAPISPHEKGAECKACRSIWYDSSWVGKPCPNLMCPDRYVGVAAGDA
jgi:hypothetical protein